MNVKQAQWQLYFLGFYTGAIDGIWGQKSKSATLAFQQAFFADPIAHDGLFGSSTAAKSQEVIDAIQDVIVKYIDYPIVNDGLAGPVTMAATMVYQKAKGLPQTGRIDKATWDLLMAESPWDDEQGGTTGEETGTGRWWDEIEYFTREELRCKCGGRYCNGYPAEPQELLVRLADRARKHFGKPAHNVSCLRCKTWNSLQGGVANSQHMYGEAMDIRIDGVTANQLLAFFKAQPEVRYCYKINATNVHFDIPKGKR